MTNAQPERRSSDARLVVLEHDVADVLVIVKSIDKALKYPEESPLGRSLTARADANRAAILALETADAVQDAQIDALQTTVHELNGVAKAMRVVSLLVGIAIGLLTLYSIAQPSIR